MTITCIVLGSVSLVCIVLRMMSRPPLPTRWTEMMDDWVLVANGVRPTSASSCADDISETALILTTP